MSIKEVINLFEIDGGGVVERVKLAQEEVIGNLLDVNTDAKEARKITVEFVFKTDAERDATGITYTIKSKLAPLNKRSTMAYIIPDENGEVKMLEYNIKEKQVPGQKKLDGSEVNGPKVIDMKSALAR